MYDVNRYNLAEKPKRQDTRCRLAPNVLASFILFISILLGWPGSVSHAAVNSETAYLLDSGDTIRIKVHEWPGFDGDIPVAADGTVGLPIIGSLKARGLQVRELAELIAERLRQSSNLSNAPSVVVSIFKYRPFFILGDVERPGEYEFRPGLTVLKAVSISGGYFRVRDTSFVRDSIIALGDLRTNTRRAHRALVRLARIKAEIEGEESFETPAELASLMRDPEIKTLIEKEREILSANLALSRQQIETSEGLSRISEEAIDSLQKEFESTTKQYEIVEKEAQRVRNMASRGLTNAERVTGVELTLSRVERARQALLTSIIRSRLTLHREQRRAEELKNEASKRLRDEQQLTLSALKEARVLQRSSEQLAFEAEVATPRGFRASREDRVRRKFILVRRAGDKTSEMEIKALAEVKPGDVINVIKVIPTSKNNAFQQPPSAYYGANDTVATQ